MTNAINGGNFGSAQVGAGNPIPADYERALGRRTADLAATQMAQAPKRFLGPLPADQLEEAMTSAHQRLAQLFIDNWDYLDKMLNGFKKLPPAQRLARYLAVATETVKQPDPTTGQMVDTGQPKYGSFEGWIRALAGINALAAQWYINDAISLQRRLVSQEATA